MEKSSTVELKNELSEINRINARLEELSEKWGLPQPITDRIMLALEELVSNIINYGFGNDNKLHMIRLIITLKHDVLSIQLIDDGKSFNPVEAPAPDINASAESRGIGGLGIYFAKKYTDSMSYERKMDKNHLTITKKITGIAS